MRREWATITVITLLLIDNLIDPSLSLVCKCIIYSSLFKSEGVFTSPNYPSPYHLEAKPYLCLIYFFLGTSKQIVEIAFQDIDIAERDESKNCGTDYIEIYDEQVISKHLITSSLHAHVKDHNKLHDIKWKYDNNTILCGNLSALLRTKPLPFHGARPRFYGSKNVLVFIFFASHGIRSKLYKGFKGIFRFLSNDVYLNKGSLIRGTECSYRYESGTLTNLSRLQVTDAAKESGIPYNAIYFDSNIETHNNHVSNQDSGYFYSPNYPKNYPPNTYCQFTFYGSPGEFIYLRLDEVFIDDGTQNLSCLHALDQLRIYDGDSNLDPLITQICSSTKINYAGSSNGGIQLAGYPKEFLSSGNKLTFIFSTDSFGHEQGFKAFYEFRRRDEASNVINSKGCDLKISSLGSSMLNGTITSPRYPHPYPMNTVCTYHFIGKGRERVQIRFIDFDLYYPATRNMDLNDCKGADFFEIATKKNDEQSILEEFCGNSTPPAILSNGHTLVIQFRGYKSSPIAKGFKFDYAFITDFAITSGKQDPSYDCAFEFNSLYANNGTFRSPNFPGLYPRDTECYFFFYGLPEEKVRVIFLYFDVEGIFPCVGTTESDYLEFSNYRSVDRKFPRYCGDTKPPTIESDSNFFRVTFKSNSLFDATGFEAHYQFFQPFEDKIYYNYPKDGATIPRGDITGIFILISLIKYLAT